MSAHNTCRKYYLLFILNIPNLILHYYIITLFEGTLGTINFTVCFIAAVQFVLHFTYYTLYLISMRNTRMPALPVRLYIFILI